VTAALIIRPEAEADLVQAAEFYGRVGHAERFEACVDAALARIAAGPLHYQIVYEDVRRILVRRYPYAIFYVAEDVRVVVLGVLRQNRDPAAWPSR
jgi:plasmid stabilization system protein ParE